MADLVSTVSTALTIVSRLKEISDKVRDAEFRNLVADLSIELAEVKLKVAGLLEENAKLRQQLNELDTTPADPCPRCRKRTYVVTKSVPDKQFGELGGIRRTYACSSCGFTEEKIET
jgi:ribosomal protein L37E